jgi:hypothetical protein
MRHLLRPLLVACLLLTACPDSAKTPAAIDAGSVDAGEPDAGTEIGRGFPAQPGAESTDALCSNGIDDDQNGYADCDDLWCRDSVTVTVCGALENTAAACTDGIDNPEAPSAAGTPRTDGLIDCADPDCAKNPLLDVCPPLAFELGAACGDGQDNDGDGLVDCADPDCLHAKASDCALNEKKRVLFDAAHRELAGSADWVVDTAGRHPFPSRPANERDWAGELSSFGKDLLDSGRFVVETLPPGDRLSFGEQRAQDLSSYSVLVIPEPSAALEDAEAKAVVDFVLAGGGLLMIADHFDSDRDGNGWDSVQVFNDMLQKAGSNPFGFTVAEISYQQSGAIERLNNHVASTIDAAQASHPVLNGPHGQVSRVGMNKGGLFTLNGAPAVALMHAVPLGTAGYENGSPYVVASEPGSGRVVAVGDSSILNDGTDSHGYVDARYDSWHDATQQNATLILNAVQWLAR